MCRFISFHSLLNMLKKLSLLCRNDEEYDFGYDDDPSPSPQGYGGTPNPQTPGYPEVPSPQVNPQYNPQTPGTPAMWVFLQFLISLKKRKNISFINIWKHFHTVVSLCVCVCLCVSVCLCVCLCACRYNTEQYSPYAAPSPQGSYQPSPSPQSYHQVAPSPVGYQNTHSPASYHPTPSPMAYQVGGVCFRCDGNKCFIHHIVCPLIYLCSFSSELWNRKCDKRGVPPPGSRTLGFSSRICPQTLTQTFVPTSRTSRDYPESEIRFTVVLSLQASPSPSPVGYSPMTPGAPSPGGYNPHTPGSNIEQGSSDWVTTDILVRVKDSFMDLMGQTGVIRSITVTHRHTQTHTLQCLVSVNTISQEWFWGISSNSVQTLT